MWPVTNEPSKLSNMNEVETFVWPLPWLLYVVYFEGDVWRDPFWLDWAKVYTDYLSSGVGTLQVLVS